jgi:hypothetical protein
MGTNPEQSNRIEASSEHAASTGTHSVTMLKWNNIGTVVACIVGICTLLAYLCGFSGDWRGVKDDVNSLKTSQTEMKDDIKTGRVKIDETHDDVERLMINYGIKPVRHETRIESEK